MSIKTDLYGALKGVAPTYATQAPQGAPVPRIVYQDVADDDEPSFDGDGQGATWVRIQVDVWAQDQTTADALATQARAALYAALTVGAMTGNPSDPDPTTKLFRASFDVTAWE